MNLHLYTIKSEYLQAFEQLNAIEDLDPQIVADSLSGLKDDLQQKAINIIAYTQNLEAEIDAMKEYERKMADRRRRLELTVDRLKDHVKQSLSECKIKKVRGSEFSLTVSDGGYSVEIENENKIDKRFQIKTVKTTVDKAAIKIALLEGIKITGAKLKPITKLTIR